MGLQGHWQQCGEGPGPFLQPRGEASAPARGRLGSILAEARGEEEAKRAPTLRHCGEWATFLEGGHWRRFQALALLLTILERLWEDLSLVWGSPLSVNTAQCKLGLASWVGAGAPGDAGRELWGPSEKATAGQPRVTLLPTPNGSGSSWEFDGPWPEIPERSPCVAGIAPVIYYSILLGLGLPVNLLTAVALARLATRTRKPSYCYLLALTVSDIVTQVVIVFVGFLLQGAVLAREVPPAVVRTANILEFAAIHASVWIGVLLTLDRYSALCRPLHHRVASSPGRTRRAITAVLGAALLTGIPFYWWLDVWRDAEPPGTLDKVLKWAHCLTVYFVPCAIFLVANSAIVHRLRQSGLRPHVGKSTAILLGFTTLFALLWAPRIFVMLYHLYVAPVHHDWRVHLALDVANMAAMLTTAINFGLYCLVSKTFRVTIREVIHDAHLSCTLGSRPEGINVEPVLKLPGFPKRTESYERGPSHGAWGA
ncbi:PREDICTED: probable G-protein coupled receptor 142 [Elephantulus edwardii]|uniref:probable G-protein coupled receptor 142 n=1 Tax=Elephantulus edwardii TaxID=28737 RepID=UPI0003F05BE7|nr:PREDICTED: probable G-protein coupled receptor 142 [Elephantulus edwardii]